MLDKPSLYDLCSWIMSATNEPSALKIQADTAPLERALAEYEQRLDMEHLGVPVLDEQTRRSMGEYQAQDLIDRLNARPSTEEAECVRRLLAVLRFLWLAAGDNVLRQEWENRREEVRAELRQFKMHPELLCAVMEKSSAKREPGKFRTKTAQFLWVDERGSTVVNDIVRLTENGLLWLIRKCEGCGKWFLARTRYQYGCSKKCRLRSPGWKAMRAEYMRNYRRKERGKS